MAINSWSHSRIGDFEKCKFLAWLKHDQKIPEPERPLRPGQTEHANDRGSRIHDSAEKFVRGETFLIKELRSFETEFRRLQELYKNKQVSLEGEWGMDENWEPTEWKTAWHRSKLDALVHLSAEEVVVIDYKSGKRYGNEIKHGEQTQLYALNTALRFPLVEKIITELWYVDLDELIRQEFTRDQALRFQANWTRRGNAMVNCVDWKPNPNIHSCKYCPYGPWGTNHCKVGIRNL